MKALAAFPGNSISIPHEFPISEPNEYSGNLTRCDIIDIGFDPPQVS